MSVDGKRAKRDAANERLRAGFLAQAGPRLLDARELLTTEAGQDVRETVASDLLRLRETAAALHLDALAAATALAAEAVRETGDTAALRGVAAALRKARGRPLFAPVVVLAEGAAVERLRGEAEAVAEDVRLVDGIEPVLDSPELEQPNVVVIPARSLDLVARVHEEGLPVIAYGEINDWSLRLAAVEAGARAFVPGSFELASVMDVARGIALSEEDAAPQVFVLADKGPERDALVAALEAAGVPTMASSSPSEIAPALDVVCPDVVVIGARVGERVADLLVRAVRGHTDCGDVPIVVVGDGAEACWAAGADEVLPAALASAEVVARVRRLVSRYVAITRERDRVTRLPTRVSVLRVLDRYLTNARRRGDMLAVSLVGVEGYEDVRERYGRAGTNAAQRVMAAQLEGGVRRIDIVGQLRPDTYLVALPSCREREARRRMTEIASRFLRRARGDQRLKDLGMAFGVADTETSVDRLVHRAEEDLARARSGS